MDKANSFMNWGFKPSQKVDELYYGIYKHWTTEEITYQSPALFKPFDKSPLLFLENMIRQMSGEIMEQWEGYFERFGEDIISGGARFPMNIEYFGKKIQCPFLEVNYDYDDLGDGAFNALYNVYPQKLAKEIVKSITNDNLQNFLKEKREFAKDKPWYRNTVTILLLNDAMWEDNTKLSLTLFNKKF